MKNLMNSKIKPLLAAVAMGVALSTAPMANALELGTQANLGAQAGEAEWQTLTPEEYGFLADVSVGLGINQKTCQPLIEEGLSKMLVIRKPTATTMEVNLNNPLTPKVGDDLIRNMADGDCKEKLNSIKDGFIDALSHHFRKIVKRNVDAK